MKPIGLLVHFEVCGRLCSFNFFDRLPPSCVASFSLGVMQVKGKAAIDGLGSRLGKSGASFMQQGLVLAFGNILNAAPVVAGVAFCTHLPTKHDIELPKTSNI